jgi:endonuclease/exonuclease/phosphatase (EEP) superfamily protein YafD
MAMGGLRLVAWNCGGRFRDKWNPLVLRLDPDVAVLSECAPLPETDLAAARTVTQAVQPIKSARPKYFGVFAREPWRVEEVEYREKLPWLVHARVSHAQGRFEAFDVFAVWAQGPEFVEKAGYARQTSAVIKEVLAKLDKDYPVVLAGDLNTPVLSDPNDAKAHDENVRALRELDLVSAFSSSFFGQAPLEHPTYFAKWRKEAPFHIDHVFLPFNWCDRHGFEMGIGRYDEWVAKESRLSDHVPLVVTVAGPKAPKRKTWDDLLAEQPGKIPRLRGVAPAMAYSPGE